MTDCADIELLPDGRLVGLEYAYMLKGQKAQVLRLFNRLNECASMLDMQFRPK